MEGTPKRATCFCGAVEVEVSGPAVSQGYCHCGSCRAFTAQPFIAYAIWPAPNVSVTRGDASLAAAPRNDMTTHRFCKDCGGHVMNELNGGAVVDVYPMIIEGHRFEPQAHMCYAERVIDFRDGLPKYRDMTERSGGSGQLIPE